jgi:hypothetical protein
MKQSEAYTISVEDQEIVIRLNEDMVDQEVLTKLLDYIELESIRRRSKLDEAEASALAAEVDSNAWENIKEKILGE